MHPSVTSALLAPLLVVSAVATGQWPVDSPTITRGFEPPSADWLAGHRGVDLAAQTGDPVRSMAAGTIGFAGQIGGVPVVTVRYPGSGHRRSTYEPVTASVHAGQRVAQGELIGTIAPAGGHCGGRGCLHVGLKTDAGYLDPASLLRRPPAVLKPTADATGMVAPRPRNAAGATIEVASAALTPRLRRGLVTP
jgi:murein DD-endopeptidase MepM/ murein hydrolase activator NlpD